MNKDESEKKRLHDLIRESIRDIDSTINQAFEFMDDHKDE